MGHYYSLYLISMGTLVSWLRAGAPGYFARIFLPVNFPPVPTIAEVATFLEKQHFCFKSIDTPEIVWGVYNLGQAKSYFVREGIEMCFPADLARVMFEAETGFPLITGDDVLRLVREFEMAGIKLLDLDVNQRVMRNFDSSDIAEMASMFEETAKELHAGLAKGYSDAISVICG